MPGEHSEVRFKVLQTSMKPSRKIAPRGPSEQPKVAWKRGRSPPRFAHLSSKGLGPISFHASDASINLLALEE